MDKIRLGVVLNALCRAPCTTAIRYSARRDQSNFIDRNNGSTRDAVCVFKVRAGRSQDQESKNGSLVDHDRTSAKDREVGPNESTAEKDRIGGDWVETIAGEGRTSEG